MTDWMDQASFMIRLEHLYLRHFTYQAVMLWGAYGVLSAGVAFVAAVLLTQILYAAEALSAYSSAAVGFVLVAIPAHMLLGYLESAIRYRARYRIKVLNDRLFQDEVISAHPELAEDPGALAQALRDDGPVSSLGRSVQQAYARSQGRAYRYMRVAMVGGVALVVLLAYVVYSWLSGTDVVPGLAWVSFMVSLGCGSYADHGQTRLMQEIIGAPLTEEA